MNEPSKTGSERTRNRNRFFIPRFGSVSVRPVRAGSEIGSVHGERDERTKNRSTDQLKKKIKNTHIEIRSTDIYKRYTQKSILQILVMDIMD